MWSSSAPQSPLRWSPGEPLIWAEEDKKRRDFLLALGQGSCGVLAQGKARPQMGGRRRPHPPSPPSRAPPPLRPHPFHVTKSGGEREELVAEIRFPPPFIFVASTAAATTHRLLVPAPDPDQWRPPALSPPSPSASPSTWSPRRGRRRSSPAASASPLVPAPRRSRVAASVRPRRRKRSVGRRHWIPTGGPSARSWSPASAPRRRRRRRYLSIRSSACRRPRWGTGGRTRSTSRRGAACWWPPSGSTACTSLSAPWCWSSPPDLSAPRGSSSTGRRSCPSRRRGRWRWTTPASSPTGRSSSAARSRKGSSWRPAPKRAAAAGGSLRR